MNDLCGPAKAGSTTSLSGMRNRLTGTGLHVVTAKPGGGATRMTEETDLSAALTATRETVARKRSGNSVNAAWLVMMTIILDVPKPIFRQLRIDG